MLCALIVIVALSILAIRSVLRLGLRWDTFSYHIPFASLRGGLNIPYEMNEEMYNFYQGFPPLPHLIQGILWRITGSMNATGVVNYIAFCIFLVFCHRKLNARFWLVALIALTTPMILIHVTDNYIDLFSNSFLAIGISSCIYMYHFNQYQDRSLLIWSLFGLVAAAWSKYQLVPVTAVFFIFLLIIYLRPKFWVAKKRRKFLAIVAMGLIIAASPYIKNLAFYQNPFWPLKLPLVGEWFPYEYDQTISLLKQKPPPLTHLSQIELFIHSLFEINHPTSYNHRPRWIIDQGNAWLAFRMGGFWNISVVINLILVVILSLLFHRKKGTYLILAMALFLCFQAILPQSHELRYYQYLPLSWAATIAMLFPHVYKEFPRISLCILLLLSSLFLYITRVNWHNYNIEKIDYLTAAKLWGASTWWDQLKPGVRYCVVGMQPISIFMTGPTMSEFYIIDRYDEKCWPENSVIIKK